MFSKYGSIRTLSSNFIFSTDGRRDRRTDGRTNLLIEAPTTELKKCPLWKHILEYHPQKGHQVKFKLIVTGLFFDSLTRQADEGQRIQDRKGKLMNSKSEFNAPKIKRISVRDVNLD